jgi:peptidoglycan/xylan/chitin deacetylase (PgdA/CDA1 family)
MRIVIKRGVLCLLLLLAAARLVASQDAKAPIYVALWFDTEDYILPQDDDAAKRIAELLTSLGVRATFKVVGEKARVLDQRGRRDVIAALKKHDIGYHSNTHSQQPTVAVYLQNAAWEDGQEEFLRREEQGVKDVERIFGVHPSAYGQPGSAWAPQTYPALRTLGIHVYLDEADHVGLDDQPFYYGGMLNVFRMRSNLVRMALSGGKSLEEGQAAFGKVYDKLRARGGGTISIYYHPNEWVQTEFWDAVNFRRGANPPRSEWKQPGVRPREETEKAFADFEQFVRFMKARDGVRFVTATDLAGLYADRALTRSFGGDEIRELARAARQEITFRTSSDDALSAADTFALLTDAGAALARGEQLPSSAKLAVLDGPARPFVKSTGGPERTALPGGPESTAPEAFDWTAFAAAVRDTSAYCHRFRRIPSEVWVGAESLSPADYLATLAGAIEATIAAGKPPSTVERLSGRFTSDKYVAEDSPALWDWIIFPGGFHAPHLMELARLQAWTLKPAVFEK